MKKKILSLLLAGVMVASMLTGCGGDKKSDESGDGTVELELFSTKSENVKTLQGLIDKFTEANPKVKITITAPSDAGTVLKTRLTKKISRILSHAAVIRHIQSCRAPVYLKI